MYRDSGKIVQDRCWASQGLLSAFGMHKQVGVVAGRGRVQPIQFPRDPEARFIKVDDIRFPRARHGHRLERRRLDRTAFQDIEDRATIQRELFFNFHYVIIINTFMML